MSLREEMWKYEQITGESAERVPIIKLGAFLDGYEMALKALEQTRWIPCSERMPEVGSEVLVCFDFKGNRSVYISDFYGDGEFHGLDDEYLTPEGRKCRKAVAWMPLPQPYIEREGEE